MMNKITIREAKESDYNKVNQLYLVPYSLYYKNIPSVYNQPPKTMISKGTFLSILEDKNAKFFVAELDNEIAGMVYALIEEQNDEEIAKGYRRVNIEEIAVFDQYSRSGIGSKLIFECEKFAKQNKIIELNVLTYSFNKKAIDFYQKNGFSPYSLVLKKRI
jgi:hypothetical protein